MTAPKLTPDIRAERLLARLDALAALTDPARPYTRRAFTPDYERGRDWLWAEMQGAGLSVVLDEGGNLIGSRAGRELGASLMLGSHTDTVVGGGRFDGILGVLAALEVADSLRDAGLTLRHRLEIVDFLSEEPSDYGASCVGSRALAGTLTPAHLEGQNAAGETLAQAMQRAGAAPERLTGPLREVGSIAAYLELHIEQGPVLESAGISIGIVQGIVGIERFELTFGGRADHAGTTPMGMRQDALLAAARAVDLLHSRAEAANLQHPDAPLVATVGQLRVWPGNSNVVPDRVQLVFEARTLNAQTLSDFTGEFVQAAAEGARALGVTLEARLVSRAAPLTCDGRVQAALARACQHCDLPFLTLLSGAGHDAMQIGQLAPAGMLFVPSAGGRSHTPDEFTPAADLIAGARVLLHAALDLDRTLNPSTESHTGGAV
jgi:N-carbamoyl-L-amino-acid hydrolase